MTGLEYHSLSGQNTIWSSLSITDCPFSRSMPRETSHIFQKWWWSSNPWTLENCLLNSNGSNKNIESNMVVRCAEHNSNCDVSCRCRTALLWGWHENHTLLVAAVGSQSCGLVKSVFNLCYSNMAGFQKKDINWTICVTGKSDRKILYESISGGFSSQPCLITRA